ncbi:TPA: hypothetical protein ACH3X3_009379 [Trebouxia sp. C0006]
MKQDCLQPRQLTNSFEPGENVLLRLPGTKVQQAAADLKSSCVTAPVAAPVAVVRPVREKFPCTSRKRSTYKSQRTSTSKGLKSDYESALPQAVDVTDEELKRLSVR